MRQEHQNSLLSGQVGADWAHKKQQTDSCGLHAASAVVVTEEAGGVVSVAEAVSLHTLLCLRILEIRSKWLTAWKCPANSATVQLHFQM